MPPSACPTTCGTSGRRCRSSVEEAKPSGASRGTGQNQDQAEATYRSWRCRRGGRARGVAGVPGAAGDRGPWVVDASGPRCRGLPPVRPSAAPTIVGSPATRHQPGRGQFASAQSAASQGKRVPTSLDSGRTATSRRPPTIASTEEDRRDHHWLLPRKPISEI